MRRFIPLFFLIVILLGNACQHLDSKKNILKTEKDISGNEDILVLVVHQKNPIENIHKNQIKSIYLKKERYWANQEEIFCLDFPSGTEERESFSNIVFNKNSYLMKKYWIQIIERGYPARQPMEIGRANRIMAFIHRNKNAIGYMRLNQYEYFKKNKKYNVKYLKIHGIEASLSNAQSKQYPLIINYRIPDPLVGKN